MKGFLNSTKLFFSVKLNLFILIIHIVLLSVLVLAIGLVLGLKETKSITHIMRVLSGRIITKKELLDKKVYINGKNYNLIKKNDNWFVEVPHFTAQLTLPSLLLPDMFGKLVGRIYNENTAKKDKVYEGRDSYFNIPYMNIGIVKVTYQGKILGGYIKNSNQQLVLMDKIKHQFKDGYEIGEFSIGGYGGINMLKLQKFKAIIDNDDSTTEGNVPKQTIFRFYEVDGKVVLATRDPTEKNNQPSDIGVNQPIDELNGKLMSLADRSHLVSADSTVSDRQNDINFTIREFKNKDGMPITVLLDKNRTITNSNPLIKNIDLETIYYPIRASLGSYNHPVLGLLQGRFDKNGNKVIFLDGLKNSSLNSFMLKKGFKFDVPKSLWKLYTTSFDDNNYGSTSKKRSKNELLINAPKRWIDFFRETANRPSVKQFAQRQGITIRFKLTDEGNERKYISTVSVEDKSASEVFFLPPEAMNDFNSRNFLAPLKYDLLKSFNNKRNFKEFWKEDAMIQDNTNQINKKVLGAYPFKSASQIVAYNVNYLPNGLVFDKNHQDLADFLVTSKLGVKGIGTIKEMETKADPKLIKEEHKKGLLATGHLIISGPLWAFNFYKNSMVDQSPLQQDVYWKRKSWSSSEKPIEKSYWSALVDPELKNDKRFIRFVNHYKNSNEKHRIVKDTTWYPIRALFNGYVGAIIIAPWWVFPDWKKGNVAAYDPNNDNDEKKRERKDFAENKIRFQSIPNAMNNGWYTVMASTLKKQENKQKVAERFLNTLLASKWAKEFNDNGSVLPAKKGVSLSGSDKITAGLSAAINSSRLLSPSGITDKVFDNWKVVIEAIRDDSTPEQVANKFKEQIRAQNIDGKVFVPIKINNN